MAVTPISAETTVANNKYTIEYFDTTLSTLAITSKRTIVAPTPFSGATIIPNTSLPFNQLNSQIIGVDPNYKSACATFAFAALMTYHSKYFLSPNWMKRSGASVLFDESVKLITMNGNQAFDIDRYAGSLIKIRNSISNGKPVVVKCTGNGQYGVHWVMAYGYTGNCTQKSDVMVVDSAISNTNLYGVRRNLDESMIYNKVADSNGNYNIGDIITLIDFVP